MINITLPDGSVKQFDHAVTALEVCQSISQGLARNAVCAEVDGAEVDMNHVIDKDATYKVYTLKDEQGLAVLRHSTAHLMAQAISHLYPQAKFAIGPSIKNGFYYDIDFEGAEVAPEDFALAEYADTSKLELQRIVREGLDRMRKEME